MEATPPRPRWAVSNRESVRREAAPYRELTPEQRIALLEKACATATALLELHADRSAALTYRDPLPPSSVTALARLRAEARGRRAP